MASPTQHPIRMGSAGRVWGGLASGGARTHSCGYCMQQGQDTARAKSTLGEKGKKDNKRLSPRHTIAKRELGLCAAKQVVARGVAAWWLSGRCCCEGFRSDPRFPESTPTVLFPPSSKLIQGYYQSQTPKVCDSGKLVNRYFRFYPQGGK